MLDSYCLAYRNRTFYYRKVAVDDSPNRFDLLFGHRNGAVAPANNTDHGGSRDHLRREIRMQAAKQVSAEKRALDSLDPIGPLSALTAAGKKSFISAKLQVAGTQMFTAGPYLQREPGGSAFVIHKLTSSFNAKCCRHWTPI